MSGDRALIASWHGRCGVCDGTIRPGEFCRQVEGEIAHSTCVGSSRIEPITRAVCPECFTEVSVSGACLCGSAS